MSNLFANRKDRTLYVYDGGANYIVAQIFQVILQLLFIIIIMSTMTHDESQVFSKTQVYVYIICILNEISIGLTPLSYSKVLGQNFYKDMGFKKLVKPLQIPLLVGIALLTVVTFAPVASYVKMFFDVTGYNTTNISTLKVTNGGELVAGLVALALVPAILEEILYRGMVARAFTRKSFVFAIFMSGFLFAIMHGNPIQFTHQFFMGVVCAIVYFATGSIYAPMIIHFTNNTIAVVGSYIVYLHPFEMPLYLSLLMIFVGFIILSILLFTLIWMNNKKASLHRGLRAFNATYQECFENNKAQDTKQAEVDAAIKESGLTEMQEVYEQAKFNMDADEKLKSRRAMIFALFLAIFIFVVNTITGYVN